MESTSGSTVRVLKVKNKMGIHARPAAMIVRLANRYGSTDVWVEKGSEKINGKSIMGLMMLAAGEGSQLKFLAKGPDADRVLDEMARLFERQFEEA